MILADAIAFLTVTELGARIRARSLSPVDLTETYLARIDRLGPRLSCFVTVTREIALAEARRASEEIAAGRYRGPLHGIPYGLKDLLDTAGTRTTWGAKPYADRVPSSDATVVRRLRDAGAVLLGKLSMIELAGGLGYHYGDAALNGACRTPWDENRWAGGSSSGSGSAVAAGLVGFAIGSETWGSIVCPASFCGVTGHRPTYGVVSRRGAMALSWSMDKLGPMCRSAADCALVLSAIAGRDPGDPSSVDPPAGLATVSAERARGMKAAALDVPDNVDPAIRDAYAKAIEVLRGAGMTITKAALPDFPYTALAMLFITAEVRAAFEELLRSGRVRALSARAKPDWKEDTSLDGATAVDYVKAMQIRRLAQAALDAFFTRHDVVLWPGMLAVAPRADENFDKALDYKDTLGAAGNVAGLPGVSVPCGFAGPERGVASPRLPVSLQIVGKPFDDAAVLSVGALFQSRTRWHQERPPIR